MYRKIEDFITEWEAEAKATLKVFANITDKVMSEKLNQNVRSLERLAWHITQTLTEMPFRAKIIPRDQLDNQPVPESFKSITDLFDLHSKELVKLLRENWQDSDLVDTIEMYGQQWVKTKVLSSLIRHQIHHRAQMTVIMRILGLKVPGVYGPAKEEWSQFGMQPQE